MSLLMQEIATDQYIDSMLQRDMLPPSALPSRTKIPSETVPKELDKKVSVKA